MRVSSTVLVVGLMVRRLWVILWSHLMLSGGSLCRRRPVRALRAISGREDNSPSSVWRSWPAEFMTRWASEQSPRSSWKGSQRLHARIAIWPDSVCRSSIPDGSLSSEAVGLERSS